jgi:cytochrome c-type biogenesis protein CcmF
MKYPGDKWIHITRRWTMVTWAFLSLGIPLGAHWAYYVLGWGGYWGWDPVENASLLPWITATAFLHSVMMQEKKGMMKVWNMVLVSATFFLCIFGTFLTRSGIVNSVHAFASGPIGMYFVVFLAIGISATVTLILSRLDFLKSEAQMESVLSRESSFLFNNLVLLASCFAILWGTLFPVISEKFTGEKISVDAPFFNKINIPIAMFLLLLTGVGPLIAWRKSSFDSLRRAFLWPTVVGVVVDVVLLALGVRSFYAIVSFGLCAFVLVSVAMEFVKGANAIATKDKASFVSSVIELTYRNTRRYGGYLVHVGVVIMFIGFTGKAFDQQATVEISKGDSITLGKYQLHLVDVQSGQNENYRWQKLVVDVSKNGEHVAILQPEKRLYLAKKEPGSNVDIRRRPNEDLYINFAGLSDDGEKVVMQAYVFPLVSWIWVGYWVVLIGTIICLIPSKSRLIYPRMEIVGVAGKHAQV